MTQPTYTLDPAAEARFETFGAHSQNWNDSAGLNPAAVKSFIAQEKERSRREGINQVFRRLFSELKENKTTWISEVDLMGIENELIPPEALNTEEEHVS